MVAGTWQLANPALGDFRSLEDVERLALQAQRMPSAEASFRNYVLNQRVDTTTQFISMASWRACGTDDLVISGLKGLPCYGALDLGATRDMTALVLTFVALAFDRWRVEDIKRELDAIGCNVELVPFGQGFKDMAPAVDVLERLVEEGKLLHGSHPLLTMAAGNAKAELDAAGNRKLSKRKSTGRIDPLIALTMAIGVAARPVPVVDVRGMIG